MVTIHTDFVYVTIVILDPISLSLPFSLSLSLLENLQNELEILTGENPHPNLMKIKGFCFQEALAVVYDEKPTMFLS